MLHRGLPFGCMGAVEGSPLRFRFNTVSGQKESNGVRCCARWKVMWSIIQAGHGGLFENVLCGLSLFKVTTRRDVTNTVMQRYIARHCTCTRY
jgi:hypothetical protein